MRKVSLFVIAVATVASYQMAWAQAPKTMDVYFIDVEGGQATLLVSPSGESLLVDTGYPETRDADRIAAIAQQAGVRQIDYLVITHYHPDHIGGVPHLATKLPIRNFFDHGPTVEHEPSREAVYRAYTAVRDKGHHTQAAPGDRIPIAGLDVQIVSAAGAPLTKPLPGAGAANPLCRDFRAKEEDKSENAQSVGMVIRYGNFRLLDIGDLTWNKERELVCPNNLLGAVAVYLTTGHGRPNAGAPVIVHALRPQVAVMNNGAAKGGENETFQTLRSSPGLEDVWQLHYASVGEKKNNSPEEFIANPDESTAHYIKLSARADGSFVVTNSRNGRKKEYRPRN